LSVKKWSVFLDQRTQKSKLLLLADQSKKPAPILLTQILDLGTFRGSVRGC